MRIESFYPVLMTANVAELAAFYTGHFGFETTFESDWYVSMAQTEGPVRFELGLLRFDHPTVPTGFRHVAAGVIVNVEVADATEEYRRLVTDGGLPAVLPLRDEEFGQRHFIIRDPAGTLIDVIENIEPSEELKAQYTAS